MKLKTKCKQCREEFDLKKSFTTRPDLIAEMGEYFYLQCPHCLSDSEYHANDPTAYQSSSYRLIGNAIGFGIIILVSLLFWEMGFITNIGLIIGGAVIAAANYSSFTSNVKAFNSYRVNRTKK